MTKFLLAAGAAALAIAAPVLADKGGNGGHGGGNGGGQSAKADRTQSGDDGGGNGGQAMKADRANGGQAMKSQRGNGGGHADRQLRADNRRQDHAPVRIEQHGNDRSNSVRVARSDFNDGFHGFRNGCPPGLDKKDNGCLPPGQATKLLGARLQTNFADSLLPVQYRSWYRDDQQHFYRSGDGFIYQVNRSNNLVDGLIPLFGGGSYYSLGDQWPQSYDFYNVPYQYRDYYSDTGGYDYRYGDGAIYRVNSNSGAVDAIVALLAGDLGVGQQLPTGYDVYNVPLDYRDRYYDTADNWYRYNDGYIYQVDPKTRLISAVINAIT